MRHNSKHSFNYHELPSMMHLMFLHRKDHFEATLRHRICALRHLYLLAEEAVADSLQPSSPLLALFTEELQNLVFAAGLFFFSHHAPHQGRKIESLQRRRSEQQRTVP